MWVDYTDFEVDYTDFENFDFVVKIRPPPHPLPGVFGGGGGGFLEGEKGGEKGGGGETFQQV